MKVWPHNQVRHARPGSNGMGPFARSATIWLLVFLGVGLFLAIGDRASLASQAVGNASILIALIYGTIVCARAALKRGDAARGWALMALSWVVGALGQIMFSLSAAQGGAPSPVLNTMIYMGYSVPVVAALFAFPKPPALLISRFRSILDALVIALGLLFISGATVLHTVWDRGSLQTVAVLSGLAYPVADLAICSVVFTLGMRQSPRNRLTWLCLGSGLVVLTVTDSIYVRWLADGQTNLTATPMVIGWMAAPVLSALATLLPKREPRVRVRDLSLTSQLIPYAPVWGAIVVLAMVVIGESPFLLVVGILLLLAVTLRQVMIVYENVSLTRDLEAKVAARTVELTTLGSIVTSSSDAIIGVALDGVVTAWNPAAEHLYGHRAVDVVGRMPDFMSAVDRESGESLLQLAREGRPLSAQEINFRRPDGITVPVALRVSPIRDGDVVRGISIFGQDITERKRVAAALETAREEALESSRLKSEFLATMSHEIRTPMNGVIGLTSLLLDSDLDASQRRYAEGVGAAGESLLAVINDILDFSKLDAGKVILDRTDFDPRRLMEDVGALLAPAAFAKGLELVAYCLPDVPRTVYGDPGRIRQILLNLASNAVKFTADGEVAISVTPLALSDEQITLRFDVTDSGIGVAPEDQDRLFEPFSQADASTTRRFGGTGLGLAICRRLVQVMGGEMGVKSELGAGSNFWFQLPLPLGSRTVDLPVLNPDQLRDLRILVVDDNATNRSILEVQLRSWRLRPDVVESAAQALARLRAAAARGTPYDIAVLDMFMPEMDGLQLAQAISGDPLLTGTQMLMLTSNMQVDPGALEEAGIAQWLTKPVRSAELHDKLTRLMVNKADPPIQRPEVPDDQGPGHESLGRILLVEDNSLNQLVAEGLLARLGYETFTVANGAEALDAVGLHRYSAVLMDCHMPVMDGFTATKEIRRRQTNSYRVPIIAMTASALAEDRERCLAVGMDDHLAKPVDLAGLKTVLTRWVKRARPASQLETSSRDAGSDENGFEHPVRRKLDERPPIDEGQLQNLRDLRSADGSLILTAVVSHFAGHSSDLLARLRKTALAGDNDQLRALAHELKGAAATAGAIHVAELCTDIESTARRHGQPPSAELLKELDVEFDRAKNALACMASVPADGSSTSG